MKNKLILLVEDNPDDELLALRVLKENMSSSDVVVVRDGEEAVEYLFGNSAFNSQDGAEMPDIIFLDIDLPKLDGIDVLKRIRNDERTSTIPVVMLTSSRDKSDINRCYAHGANSFICKSVDYKQFSHVSKQMTNYWLSLNVTPSWLN